MNLQNNKLQRITIKKNERPVYTKEMKPYHNFLFIQLHIQENILLNLRIFSEAYPC